MTETEQRLRAAFAAADAALRDLDARSGRTRPALAPAADDRSPVTTGLGRRPGGRDEPTARRRRSTLGGFAVAAAAAAAVAIVAGIAWTVAARHTSPATHTGRPTPSRTRPAPTASTSPTLRPLPGPAVSQARLLPGGHGFVLTESRLLATTDYGNSWIDQTPPGVSRAQLAGADVQTLDDTHTWLAVPDTNRTAAVTATVYRRSGPVWRKATATATGLPTLPGMQLTTSLSFATATDGWLAITAQVTSTPNGALLHTSDGGAHWTLVTSSFARTAPLPGVGPVDFISANVGWMTEPWTGRTWMTRTGGATWTPFTLPNPAAHPHDNETLLALPQRSGPRLVTAVGYSRPGSGTPDEAVVYTSPDNGTSWTVLASIATTGAAAVTFSAVPDRDSQVLLRLYSTGARAPTWAVSMIQAGTVSAASATTVPADVEALAAGDPTHLWAVVQSNACTNGKSDCFTSSGLFITRTSGRDWTLARLPT